MGTKASKKPKLRSLRNGRPPLVQSHSTTPGLSSKTTRTLIRKHHNLLKTHAKALQDGDTALAEEIARQLTAEDLKKYQLASKTGQSASRGGDSSHVLVDWLSSIIFQRPQQEAHSTDVEAGVENYRVLEIGALSTTNAISKTPNFQVTRIDLHSQEKGILQQDFMERPLPTAGAERFHIISLSLVLNFVADPKGRGEMLKRCAKFLMRKDELYDGTRPLLGDDGSEGQQAQTNPRLPLPLLFLVLPAPCVTNSRYLTEGRLEDIMSSIGFHIHQRKVTAKLYYSLWVYDQAQVSEGAVFKKKEMVGGGNRNNFAVVME